MIDGAISTSFHTGSALLGGAAWLVMLALIVTVVLRRSIGTLLRPAAGSANG